jgi:hypothetical protein
MHTTQDRNRPSVPLFHRCVAGSSFRSSVVLVTATGRDIDSYEFKLAVIRDGVPRPFEGESALRAIDACNGLRGCTGLAP